MANNEFNGCWPVAPTPFKPNGEIDKEGMKRVIDCMVDQQVDGICILANYSEQFLLSDEEREILTRLCIEHVAGRVPVITTISHFSTDIAFSRAKLVKELGLEAQVMFFNDISENLKNALISKSNIFVMPSIKYKTSVEGFGIAYIEAAQFSVPSIGGKDGGAADAIQHNKTGLICDGDNLDEIYSSLNLMLENKKFIEFGKNAKLNSDKFLWSNIIENYKEILM